MYSPRNIGVAAWRAARRDLWESHRRKIFVTSSHYPGILVARDEKEALEYVKKCDQCQKFAPNIHQLGGVLNPLSSPWLFVQWGLEIVGPFPKVTGNKRYLLVGTDYFTKWVEAEPLANIRDVDAKKFIWRNLLHDSRSLVPSFQIMDSNLIAKLLEDTVTNWGSQTSTQLQLILREMDRPRLSTKS